MRPLLLLLLGSKNVTENSKVYITNPRVYTDYSHGFDLNMQKNINIIKKELKLNQKEMKELLKFNKAEKKYLEGEQEDIHIRLLEIERKAKEIKEASIEKGLIGKMAKKNIEASIIMDEINLNRVCFTDESMEEVECNSKSLIKDVQDFLDLARGKRWNKCLIDLI